MKRRKAPDQHEDIFQTSFVPQEQRDISTMNADERRIEIERLFRVVAALRSVGKPLEGIDYSYWDNQTPSENDSNG